MSSTADVSSHDELISSLPGPMKKPESLTALLQTGFLLTGVTFVASIGHFLFQIYMGRVLSLGEFGAFNTTLSLVMMLTVPLAAASQSIAHYLARHKASDSHKELTNLQAACQKLLRRWTWILSAVTVVLIFPLTQFFNFPRASLMLVALACVPMTMWSSIGTVWCSGLSRFKLLSFLNFATMLVRFVSGAILVYFFPVAEAAAAATFVSGTVLAGAVVFGQKPDSHSIAASPWDREFMLYLVAAMAIGMSNFFFTFGDQLVAQRSMDGNTLGLYVAAGLLGRSVVLGSMPLLIVYFTQRSSTKRSGGRSNSLLVVYLAMLVTGIIMLIVLRNPLLRLMLGPKKIAVLFEQKQFYPMLDLLTHFSIVMLPLGVLQAVGNFYLASRRLLECYLFGALGLGYVGLLIVYGKDPNWMITFMFGGSIASLLILAIFSIVRWSRTQP
jgi:O-antigen/teichoic acid export membrane protein